MRLAYTRAQRAALVAIIAATGAAGSARAQDEDPEIKKLREEADKEIDKGEARKKEKPPADVNATDYESLRAAADQRADASFSDRGILARAFTSVMDNVIAFNPRMAVITDMVGRLATNKYKTLQEGSPIDDRFSVREAELDLRADIDPYAKGVLILAVEEEEPGEYVAVIEEGYFTLEQLPVGLKLKAGRSRIPFGRMNTLHTHDLPHVHAPYAIQDIFGPEGYVDNAASLSWLVPGSPLPIELSGFVLNGENERALAPSPSTTPAYMARAELFFQLTDVQWISVGASYLYGRGEPHGVPDRPRKSDKETQLFQADILYKWQPNQFKSVVVLLEYYDVIARDRFQTLDFDTGAVDANGDPILQGITKKIRDRGNGFFGMLQVQPGLQQWYFGLRGDYSNFDEGRPHHQQWAASIWCTFYTTEFLRFRVGYEHRERFASGFAGPQERGPNDTVFFEVTWVFGAHPAEPFYVNK